MPTPSFHSRRGSAQFHQQPTSSYLPYHRSKLYKPSSNKHTKASLYHQHYQKRRWRKWLLFIIILVVIMMGGRRLFSVRNNTSRLDFPEWIIARHYQPTPVTASRIPKIVHFVYGLKAPDPTLDLIHYLAIKSAHDRLKPDTIMFHYHYLPTGSLFEKSKPYLTLNKVDLVPKVFDQPVTHFAHQADIIRLNMLQHYGGIYLDLDVISMAPMDHLLNHEFVMGQEGIGGSVGLCNAVILAKPNARFLQRWQETYRTFDQSDWNYHSVVLPGKLANTKVFDNEITILNHTAFFWPLWDSQGLRTLFLEKSYDFSMNYVSHIWESAANPHLMAGLSLDVIRHVDNSLYCQLRLLLDQDQKDVRLCRRLDHSALENKLVGYWPLKKPNDKILLEINPTPATDISGNEMNGIIRNGKFYDDDGVYVSGQDSYVFLSMPNNMTMNKMTVQWQMKSMDDKQGGVAMMIQSSTCKVMIKTQAQGVLGVDILQLATNGWSWDLIHHVNGTVKALNDIYHTFTLVIDGGGGGGSNDDDGGSMLVPTLMLSMDGSVIASVSSNNWIPLEQDEQVVRGIWFGSMEPEKYQDPWDTRPSLAAWYKHVRVWEQSLTMDTIRTGFNNDQQQQQKDWQVSDHNIPITHDDNVDIEWKNADDDDGLD